jgi:hypothetical protein
MMNSLSGLHDKIETVTKITQDMHSNNSNNENALFNQKIEIMENKLDRAISQLTANSSHTAAPVIGGQCPSPAQMITNRHQAAVTSSVAAAAFQGITDTIGPHPLPPTTETNSNSNLMSWADRVQFDLNSVPTNHNQVSNNFTLVEKKKGRSVSGKKKLTESCSLKVIPRKMTVFVSRLDKSTSVEDVQAFLSNVGAVTTSCKKLSGKSKTGREFQSVAFLVTCEAKYENIIYDENTWPEECLVREWLFKKSPVSGSDGKSG